MLAHIQLYSIPRYKNGCGQKNPQIAQRKYAKYNKDGIEKMGACGR